MEHDNMNDDFDLRAPAALVLASAGGNLEVVRALLKGEMVNVNESNESGDSALIMVWQAKSGPLRLRSRVVETRHGQCEPL
jgi:hypothetical protein